MEWDVTQYSQIQMTMASKEPFDRLWKTALTFNNRYDEWMNGKKKSPNVTKPNFQIISNFPWQSLSEENTILYTFIKINEIKFFIKKIVVM